MRCLFLLNESRWGGVILILPTPPHPWALATEVFLVSPLLCGIWHGANFSAANVARHEGAFTTWLQQDNKWWLFLSFLLPEKNLYEWVSALSFVKCLFFYLICFLLSKVKCSKERQLSAVSLKSCTSCTNLGFTRLATAISRKINYDVTQSGPEGAARLHTPKTCSTLSFADDSKQNQSNRAGVNGGREGGERGYFQFQLHRWLKYSTSFKISSLK